MTTPAKEPITAEITIIKRGRAQVLFREPGISGEIIRQGIQNYIAFAGEQRGTGARYESAARALAAQLGLRKRYIIRVEITNSIRRNASGS